jgi:predicted Zn-dependent protease with MMP-like domain
MPAMDSEAFAQLVVEALDGLPEPFATYLNNVEVIVSRRPTPAQRRALGLKPWQTVYGMYDGVPYPERTSGMFVIPDTIIIFQDALVRDFRAPGELREQVRRTVRHEIAHLFGISDERLRQLGAY